MCIGWHCGGTNRGMWAPSPFLSRGVGGGAALNILTGMCEYGVSEQSHIEGVR